MKSLKDQFLETVTDLIEQVSQANRETVEALGPRIAQSIVDGGVLHLFGSGHSKIVAMEIERRAGGLVPISTVEDPTPGWPEQIPGYGKKLFERYHFQYEARAGDYIVVVSNSGKNACPLEVADAAQEAGLKVIALTSLAMSREARSQLPSGKRLFEIADHILDNLGVSGDAILPLPGQDFQVGPTSTLSGAILLNLLNLEIIEGLLDLGVELPILRSQNLPGGAEHNEKLALKYRDRIRRPI